MSRKTNQLISVTLLAFAGLTLGWPQVGAKPAARRSSDQQQASLNNALAVAKSPYEPVTLALTLPESARTEEVPLETTKLTTGSDSTPFEPENEEKRATRSTQTSFEQQSSSTTKGLDEAAGLEGDSRTTQSVATEPPEEATSETDPPSEATTEAAKTADAESVIVGEQASSTSRESTTTTAEPASPESSSSGPSSTTLVEEQPTTTAKETETTTPEPPTTTLAPTTTTTTTTTTTPASTTTEATAAPTTTTTEVPTTAEPPVAPVAEITDLRDSEQPKEEPAQPTTTTTAPSQPPTEAKPAETRVPVETTSAAPEAERELPASTSAPTVTEITTSPAPTTPEPAREEPKTREEDKLSCNHLPTYDPDEVQKVFREETTYKNGTIKGRFTYINFDQRYRLVHYTRLPYGPVKIDRVEELADPKSNKTDQTSPSLSEVPNAVLQLRNLLPNSLFGFPFLGSNNAPRAPSSGARENSANNDESNMYFYSTDSLSTPNLINPKVPVSLLPGQRVDSSRQQPPEPAPRDILAENPPVASGQPSGVQQPYAFGMPNLNQEYNKLSRLDEPVLTQPGQTTLHTSRQFHYSGPRPHQAQPIVGADKGIVYSYYTSGAHSAHHFGPPVFQPYPPRIYQPLTDPAVEPASQHQVHHHQPHSHEHFGAPFMLAQPANQPPLSAPINDNESSRLRLRVKTSKALNVHQVAGQGTKSAQLRLQDGHYSQLDSPARVLHRNQQRQQQRLGKQSYQLKSSQSNQSPVVYHVLRKPYNQQYDQGYAVAYDHEN